MYVRVKHKRTTIFLHVEPNDTILEVKQKLQELTEQVLTRSVSRGCALCCLGGPPSPLSMALRLEQPCLLTPVTVSAPEHPQNIFFIRIFVVVIDSLA